MHVIIGIAVLIVVVVIVLWAVEGKEPPSPFET